jgi:hypothetical protein
MMAAFSPECRVISTAQVVAGGQFAGRCNERTCAAQVACFLYAIQHPPPWYVRWPGRRASGRTSGGDEALVGWKCILYPLLRKMCVRAPL